MSDFDGIGKACLALSNKHMIKDDSCRHIILGDGAVPVNILPAIRI